MTVKHIIYYRVEYNNKIRFLRDREYYNKCNCKCCRVETFAHAVGT